jgi:hypothetical protein
MRACRTILCERQPTGSMAMGQQPSAWVEWRRLEKPWTMAIKAWNW